MGQKDEAISKLEDELKKYGNYSLDLTAKLGQLKVYGQKLKSSVIYFLPYAKKEDFPKVQETLEAIKQFDRFIEGTKPAAIIYCVREGDTVSGICSRANCTIGAFKIMNKRIADINKICVGEYVIVPGVLGGL